MLQKWTENIETYKTLNINQTKAAGNVIAENYHIRIQELPAFGASRVVEFKAVGTIVEFDLKDKGLVSIS